MKKTFVLFLLLFAIACKPVTPTVFPISETPVLTGATSTATATATDTAEPPTATGTPTPTPTFTLEPTATPSPLPEGPVVLQSVTSDDIYTTAILYPTTWQTDADKLNVRAGSGTQWPPVDALEQGERFGGWVTDGRWLSVVTRRGVAGAVNQNFAHELPCELTVGATVDKSPATLQAISKNGDLRVPIPEGGEVEFFAGVPVTITLLGVNDFPITAPLYLPLDCGHSFASVRITGGPPFTPEPVVTYTPGPTRAPTKTTTPTPTATSTPLSAAGLLQANYFQLNTPLQLSGRDIWFAFSLTNNSDVPTGIGVMGVRTFDEQGGLVDIQPSWTKFIIGGHQRIDWEDHANFFGKGFYTMRFGVCLSSNPDLWEQCLTGNAEWVDLLAPQVVEVK